MWELIISAALTIAKYFFEKANDKTATVKLITEWMKVMRNEFSASANMKADFDKMWAEEGPLTETGKEA